MLISRLNSLFTAGPWKGYLISLKRCCWTKPETKFSGWSAAGIANEIFEILSDQKYQALVQQKYCSLLKILEKASVTDSIPVKDGKLCWNIDTNCILRRKMFHNISNWRQCKWTIHYPPKFRYILHGNIQQLSSSKWSKFFKDIHICKRFKPFDEISLVVEDNYGLSQITRDRAGLATNHKSRT